MAKDGDDTKLQATASLPTEVEREETLSGEALVRLAVAARKQQEEAIRASESSGIDPDQSKERTLKEVDKASRVDKEIRKIKEHVDEEKKCSEAEIRVSATRKSKSESNMAPSDKQILEQKLATAAVISHHMRRSTHSSKSSKEVPKEAALEHQTTRDLIHCTQAPTVPLKRALMSDAETDQATSAATPVQHGAFAMPGLSYRDPPERQATGEASSTDGGRYDEETNPWMPDDSNGGARGATRGLDTTQGHRASALFRFLGNRGGDAAAARAPAAASGNMAIAQSVDDAEAVVYASKVEKARPRWVNWCLVACALAVILGLSLGLALSQGSSDDELDDLGDPRCIQNITDQDITDICHCTGNATNLALGVNETLLYGMLHFLFASTGLMNQTYERDSCANEHQALISLSNFQRYDVDFSAGIGFVTGDPAVLNHPNFALAQAYGIDVVEQQFIIKLLYLELGGENWPRQENWMQTALVCEFEGVTCALMERVQSISLPANNLTGTLPSQVGRLKYLRTLDLSNNPRLVGTIPGGLGALGSLREMDVSSCSLTGTLPTELGEIRGMDRMNLSNNTIGGNIPEEFGRMDRIRELNFNANQLQGTLPSGMFGMTNMENLQLKFNTFTGTIPEAIGRLQYLETLDISFNNFTGPIPNVLGNFTKLNVFSLSNNQLTGSISESYCEANRDRNIVSIIIADCSLDLNCSCCPAAVICAENLPSLAAGII